MLHDISTQFIIDIELSPKQNGNSKGKNKMNFNDLCDFIENEMRMSQIYQPLLIRSLVDSDGKATIRQLATIFSSLDESQLQYYEKRIKEMPAKVLKSHGVIDKDGDIISLRTGKLTYKEKATIRGLCEARIQKYLEKRGLSNWDHRLLDNPVPDSLRYLVLSKGGKRCALCGATTKDRVLDVDHIIPRSHGGKNVEENLQVLCSKCNRSKGNQDDTDFRIDVSENDPECVFCGKLNKKRIIQKYKNVFVIEDAFPVTKGHLLIIPIRHTPDFFSMTELERQHIFELSRVLKKQIEKEDTSVTGFNVGINNGVSAGQTIMHAHLHLIPRRDGDIKNPRGGVRGVIPDKMSY